MKFIKIFLYVIIMVFVSIVFIGCKEEDPKKEFVEIISEAETYKATGIIESFFIEGRKQSDFTVLYKSPDLIKVVIESTENNDKQVILKNSEGVYVLIPAVNKNFKIKSSWPTNASYPYLLQSISKDMINEKEPLITNDDTTYTIETETKMHADAIPVKQKIVFDKETTLPKEVLVYDEGGNLYIRVVFTDIEIDSEINNDEFVVENSMTTCRIDNLDITYETRVISYPTYYPEGVSLVAENTISSTDGSDVRSIMKFANEEIGFTVIQEFVNDKETIVYAQESGEIIMVLGNVAILKENGLQVVYNGVEYIIGSNTLPVSEIINIASSYMTNQIVEEK